MTKKQKFLLDHPKVDALYGYYQIVKYRIRRMGKSGDCILCECCKKKGCLKNKVAKKFKLANFFGADCFCPNED